MQHVIVLGEYVNNGVQGMVAGGRHPFILLLKQYKKPIECPLQTVYFKIKTKMG